MWSSPWEDITQSLEEGRSPGMTTKDAALNLEGFHILKVPVVRIIETEKNQGVGRRSIHA